MKRSIQTTCFSAACALCLSACSTPGGDQRPPPRPPLAARQSPDWLSSNPASYQGGDAVTFTARTTIPSFCGGPLQLGIQEADIPNKAPPLDKQFDGSFVVHGTIAGAFPSAPLSGAVGTQAKVEFNPLAFPLTMDASRAPTHKDLYVILWNQCTLTGTGIGLLSLKVSYTCEKYNPSIKKQYCAYWTIHQYQ